MSTVSQKRMAPRKTLHSGKSLWTDARTAPLDLTTVVPDRLVEVVIIGGGISGAISALVLSAPRATMSWSWIAAIRAAARRSPAPP